MENGEGKDEAIRFEYDRRLALERQLTDVAGGLEGISASVIKEVGLSRGEQGIFFDQEQTRHLAAPGVTLGLKYTGRIYSDDLSGEGIIYHYPSTKRPPSRDEAEISATKNAKEFKLPVYVIISDGSLRTVRRAWVEDWDDAQRVFLIRFGAHWSETESGNALDDDFALHEEALEKEVLVAALQRPHQSRFRFAVLKIYGSHCAACEISESALLDAAHVVPYKFRGVSSPLNGIPLCPTHHRAFDQGYLRLDPNGYTWKVSASKGIDLASLGVTTPSLSHLANRPHPAVVLWRWTRYQP